MLGLLDRELLVIPLLSSVALARQAGGCVLRWASIVGAHLRSHLLFRALLVARGLLGPLLTLLRVLPLLLLWLLLLVHH